MKNKLMIVLGANALILGLALTGSLSSATGSVVADSEQLTRVTGAGSCGAYDSSKCMGIGCTTSDCCAPGSLNPYAPKGSARSVDCSSSGCGSTYVFDSCGS